MFKKTCCLILIVAVFMTPIELYALSEREINAVTYYPSPNADFMTLRADTVVGSDDNYFRDDGLGNITGDGTGLDPEKPRIDGSNADYLDGLDSSAFVEDVQEFCLPWLIIYLEGSFLLGSLGGLMINGDVLYCGDKNYVKGFLYFRPPFAISIVDVLCTVLGWFGLAGICSTLASFIGDIKVGISGLGICCSFKSTDVCSATGDLRKSYDFCKDLFTELAIRPGYCINMQDAFSQCGWDLYSGSDSEITGACANCQSTYWETGWLGAVCWLKNASGDLGNTVGCCLGHTKKICGDLGYNLTSTCTYCPTECGLGVNSDYCYWHNPQKDCFKYTCGSHCCKTSGGVCTKTCPDYCYKWCFDAPDNSTCNSNCTEKAKAKNYCKCAYGVGFEDDPCPSGCDTLPTP